MRTWIPAALTLATIAVLLAARCRYQPTSVNDGPSYTDGAWNPRTMATFDLDETGCDLIDFKVGDGFGEGDLGPSLRKFLKQLRKALAGADVEHHGFSLSDLSTQRFCALTHTVRNQDTWTFYMHLLTPDALSPNSDTQLRCWIARRERTTGSVAVSTHEKDFKKGFDRLRPFLENACEQAAVGTDLEVSVTGP
jgi:hypothetical protein